MGFFKLASKAKLVDIMCLIMSWVIARVSVHIPYLGTLIFGAQKSLCKLFSFHVLCLSIKFISHKFFIRVIKNFLQKERPLKVRNKA